MPVGGGTDVSAQRPSDPLKKMEVRASRHQQQLPDSVRGRKLEFWPTFGEGQN